MSLYWTCSFIARAQAETERPVEPTDRTLLPRRGRGQGLDVDRASQDAREWYRRQLHAAASDPAHIEEVLQTRGKTRVGLPDMQVWPLETLRPLTELNAKIDPVSISGATSSSALRSATRLIRHLRQWEIDYEKWIADRKPLHALWLPQPQGESRTVVQSPVAAYDIAFQRVLAQNPDVQTWELDPQRRYRFCPPVPTLETGTTDSHAPSRATADPARKGAGWRVAYEGACVKATSTKRRSDFWSQSDSGELILDLVDIIYNHWSRCGKPSGFELDDETIKRYRGRAKWDSSDWRKQQDAMRELPHFCFFNKDVKCHGERLLRCQALTVAGRAGQTKRFNYRIEIGALWRRQYKRGPALTPVTGAFCLSDLWKLAGHRKLARQLTRYLRWEWRRHAAQYVEKNNEANVLDGDVPYAMKMDAPFRSWRYHLEYCGVPVADAGYQRLSEFYSLLAKALTTLQESGFLGCWDFPGASMPQAWSKHDPAAPLVAHSEPCLGRNGFAEFLKQEVRFQPADIILEALGPVADRQSGQQSLRTKAQSAPISNQMP